MTQNITEMSKENPAITAGLQAIFSFTMQIKYYISKFRFSERTHIYVLIQNFEYLKQTHDSEGHFKCY